MTRSILICAALITGLMSCKDNTAHRPGNPFIYAFTNNARIIDGKDTVTRPVDPDITVNDLIRLNRNGNLSRVIRVDNVKKFKHIILPVPPFYFTRSTKFPDILKAYCSGDTLILCYIDTLHFYHPVPNSYKNAKRVKAIDLQTGQVISCMITNNKTIGDSIMSKYKIIALQPYTETLQVDLPEEIEAISSDSTHPDLVQVSQHATMDILQLGFYHPGK